MSVVERFGTMFKNLVTCKDEEKDEVGGRLPPD